ncbi:MAG TPA: hypothetical protein PKI20_05590 [Verrucomicrobiota bacterium]|nr:hypothetical protein [Verrucomicrobiota bacterium]
MKPIALVVALGAALVWMCGAASAQTDLGRGSPPVGTVSGSASRQINVIVTPSQPSRPASRPSVPVVRSDFGNWTLPPAARCPPPRLPLVPSGFCRTIRSNLFAGPFAPPGIPAGVYKTAPYSCIVVVPGACRDDQSVITPKEGSVPMPRVEPELRFIP